MDGLAPHELLDDGFAPVRCDLLVVGCGNILRGDDAVGPRLIRQLWEEGVPDGVRIVDGGTAGMDVAFQMRGAGRVIIVDAASSGRSPGTLYRVPGAALAELPPLDGLHTHSFRWDHALAFGRWLLGPDCPADVTVLLIEAGDLTPGADLSEPVLRAMHAAVRLVRAEFPGMVSFTADGYLHLDARVAATFFPADAVGAYVRENVLYLAPVAGVAHGGHLLKQRNARGDRSLLVRELAGDGWPAGACRARWDDSQGALAVDLTAPT
ncbi:hydrogenase maturation protease [Cryptosporangium sp. NPDC051539]|uniref:hydrogenase maturation protease n=1 Tax=Cryptosporangium sp. NPDC051539 TaxID=3363962 RepID=UPI003787F7C1